MTEEGAVGAVRSLIARAWYRTLEEYPTDDQENFFDAGGNSVLLVQIQRELTEALGVKIPLRGIHLAPSVEGLLKTISELAPSPSRPTSGQIDLYCLPYAGCSARMFDAWRNLLPGPMNLVPLELPGRGSRGAERAINNLPDLLQDLSRILGDRDGEFAIFGHCFGALVANELIRFRQSQGLSQPRHLIVSASPAPHLATPEEQTHDLPFDELRERLRLQGATPTELLENDELMELYAPTLRADYTIYDHYRFVGDGRLECPVLALYGEDDTTANRAGMEPWRDYTTGPFAIELVAGGHFFVQTAEETVVEKICRQLGVSR
ncbi:medium-chain acyl-[acyl-carrier-protein] hydrolase [Streptomyces umbrinus]|uniref:Medium-chain acyl-[acyl-carrier-protein] hydrolase n=1 Tax=Streptomyces umbrinus TaxID=67370 RepID=A0ABU0SMF6_9ACTN|nr:alpha/beta fold hydrolase [Streptomyces umbrinus]MDQ1024735.1 medium-chain acyl-[acyl-carrier-protein] hydrolase [Streptomyces umbrinus]